MSKIMALCTKCRNYEACKHVCAPVEKLLADVTDGSLEKQTGENELMHFGNHYWEKRFSEIHPSTLNKAILDAAIVKDEEEKEDPEQRHDDLEFTPQQKHADIFYMRFFLGKSYEEIGKKYGMDHRDAASRYSWGRKRALRIMEILDGRDKGITFATKSQNAFTKYQKAFIMNKIFDVSLKEVAEALGYRSKHHIRHVVNTMYREIRESLPEKAA
jgi:DNA-directed RNA polymerase specialized sigma24 family protein